MGRRSECMGEAVVEELRFFVKGKINVLRDGDERADGRVSYAVWFGVGGDDFM
jgi:hypothetical protein